MVYLRLQHLCQRGSVQDSLQPVSQEQSNKKAQILVKGSVLHKMETVTAHGYSILWELNLCC